MGPGQGGRHLADRHAKSPPWCCSTEQRQAFAMSVAGTGLSNSSSTGVAVFGDHLFGSNATTIASSARPTLVRAIRQFRQRTFALAVRAGLREIGPGESMPTSPTASEGRVSMCGRARSHRHACAARLPRRDGHSARFRSAHSAHAEATLRMCNHRRDPETPAYRRLDRRHDRPCASTTSKDMPPAAACPARASAPKPKASHCGRARRTKAIGSRSINFRR